MFYICPRIFDALKTNSFTLSPLSAMGYAKSHYSDPEAYQPQQGVRSSTGTNQSSNTRQRRQSMAPGRIVLDREEAPPFAFTWRLLWMRFNRSFIALRFQVHRYTLGIFRQNTLLKIGTLALGSYFLLFAEAGPQIISRDIEQSEHGIVPILDEEYTGSKPASKPVKTKSKPKNEAAPVSSSELFAEQAEDYVDRFHDIAIAEMKKYGIPASISLAQGLIESRAGTSKLAVNNNNHFGIKCFSRNCKKGHCTNFTDDTHKDFFRKFKNPWESWRAHSQLLAAGRYTKLKKHGRDYRKWAYGLKSVGYATDRNYAEKLIGIIERYELYKFDR